VAKLDVVGFDPSLNNWGVARGIYCTESQGLEILELDVIKPVLPTGKQVRQNSKDLQAALQLSKGASMHSKGADAIFIEVPIGSQSARAMASYGICVGVLGSLRSNGVPFFEVTPTEVKLATVGSKTASKTEMIEWGTTHQPQAPWPTRKVKGVEQVITGKAEHMADAIGAIKAGTQLDLFNQLTTLLNNRK
tara:strand:- start:7786 stop:8361 length:576 start_codon:yes stop_codon:yes gene_type:complete